jgi:hypothetical protein
MARQQSPSDVVPQHERERVILDVTVCAQERKTAHQSRIEIEAMKNRCSRSRVRLGKLRERGVA